MYKLPMVIVYMIIAVNISGFTGFLLLDLLIIKSIIVKVIASLLTIASWMLAYIKRDAFIRVG